MHFRVFHAFKVCISQVGTIKIDNNSEGLDPVNKSHEGELTNPTSKSVKYDIK